MQYCNTCKSLQEVRILLWKEISFMPDGTLESAISVKCKKCKEKFTVRVRGYMVEEKGNELSEV